MIGESKFYFLHFLSFSKCESQCTLECHLESLCSLLDCERFVFHSFRSFTLASSYSHRKCVPCSLLIHRFAATCTEDDEDGDANVNTTCFIFVSFFFINKKASDRFSKLAAAASASAIRSLVIIFMFYFCSTCYYYCILLLAPPSICSLFSSLVSDGGDHWAE